jgi:hypothetical protein
MKSKIHEFLKLKKNVMSKKIFLVIVAIGLFSTSFAQFTYGPKLGVNMSKLPNDNLRPGFQAGGFLNGEFWDRMGLQVDFLWTLKGNSHTHTDSLRTVTTNTITGLPTINTSTVAVITTTYYRFVDVPICAYFPISEHIRGFIGPQISVFKHASQTVTAGSAAAVKSDISGIKGQTSICLGFDLKSNSPIILGVRFVTNKFTGGGSTDPKNPQTLSSFMINVAYRMNW